MFIKSVSDTAGDSQGNIFFGLIAAIPLLAIGVWLNRIHGHLQAGLLQNFALKNQFQFLNEGEPYDHIQTASGQFVSDLVIGSYANFPFRLFLEAVFVGDSQAAIEHDVTVLEFKLQAQTPHLLLIPKNTPLHHIGLISDFADLLATTFSDRTDLSLEGDFANKFHLYGETNQEVAALKIFNPELMSFFEDQAASYIAEFHEDMLVLYAYRYASSIAQLEQLLETASGIASRI